MNINKIREALERVPRTGDNNVDFWVGEALAELYKAPKVLTDEEIERIQDEDHAEAERNGEFDRDSYKDDEIYQIYMERSHAWTEGKRDGLRYARDNGYLAPSAGLTVDAELIQQLFDALYAEQFVPSLGPSPLTKPAIAAAAAAGFKPSEP